MTRRHDAPAHRSLSRHLFSALWVIAAVTALTMLLERGGLFDRFETTGLDALNVAGRAARDPADIVIVVTDELRDLLAATRARGARDCPTIASEGRA